jgi:hypothetical protein
VTSRDGERKVVFSAVLDLPKKYTSMQNKNMLTISHTVPEDMLMDTLNIFFKAGILFQIESINEK